MAARRAPKQTLNTPFLEAVETNATRARRPRQVDATPFQKAPADRWRHGAERQDAPAVPGERQAPQRVRSVTESLVASGRLHPSDHVAALRWLRDHELGVHGARSNEESVSGVSVSDGGYDLGVISTLDALSRDGDAARAVGKFGNRLLVAALFEARSLTSLASEFTPQPIRDGSARRPTTDVREVTGLLVATVARLSEHYAQVDGSPRRRSYADYVPVVDRVQPRERDRRTETVADVPWDGRSARGGSMHQVAA